VWALEIDRHLEQERLQRFDLTEFWQRVTERQTAAVDLPDAAFHSRAGAAVRVPPST